MEAKEKAKKGNLNGVVKTTIVVGAGVFIWWLLNRIKIEISNVDTVNRTAVIRVTMGVKTVDRVVSAYAASENFNIFKNFKMYLTTDKEATKVGITIINTKTDEKLDYAEILFNGKVR